MMVELGSEPRGDTRLVRNACLIGSVAVHLLIVFVVFVLVPDRPAAAVPVRELNLFMPSLQPGENPDPVGLPEPIRPDEPLGGEPDAPDADLVSLPETIDIPTELPPLEEPVTPPDTAEPGTGDTETSDPVDRLLAPGGQTGDVYAGRSDPKLKQGLIEKRGGSPETQNAVKAGLDWLARHQDEDGRWDPDGFSKHDPEDDPSGNPDLVDRIYGDGLEVGLTALATLAFLGDGNTHKAGPYRQAVDRALKWLVENRQRADGGIARSNDKGVDMYGHAIATLALAECYAMTGDKALRRPVARAVEFIARAQTATGGWDYFSVSANNRSDVSVTGWQIMALASARNAGLDVPWKTLLSALKHLDDQTDPDGKVRYNNVNYGTTDLRDRGGAALVSVAALCRLLIGYRLDTPELQHAVGRIMVELPDWNELSHHEILRKPYKMHSMYTWYHGTLVLASVGGQPWEVWNKALKATVLPNQRTVGSARGSWDPEGVWGRLKGGGRIYSTALNVLNLEVYYRLLPLYKLPDDDTLVDGIVEQLKADMSSPALRNRRIDWVKLLGKLRFGRSVEVLADLAAGDDDATVRLAALESLSGRNDPAFFTAMVPAWGRAGAGDKMRMLALLDEHDVEATVPLLVVAVTEADAGVARRAGEIFTRITHRELPALPVAENEAPVLRASLLKWFTSTDAPLWRQRSRKVPGAVLAYLPDGRELLVDLGRKQGLAAGMTLDVYRDKVRIGRCVVERVFDDRSTARYEPGTRPVRPRKGDEVVARIAKDDIPGTKEP